MAGERERNRASAKIQRKLSHMKDRLRRHRRRLAAKKSVGAAGQPGTLHHQADRAAGLRSCRTVRVLAGGVRREIGGGHGRAQRDPEAPLTRAARYT